jgi:hypothetical protein
MPRFDDARIYRTFEEFEREELRRMDAVGSSVDELLDDIFAEDLDFDATTRRRKEEEEEEDLP